MPAQYVKPYLKTNKGDYIDAEAIAEAVERPKMRFVRLSVLQEYGNKARPRRPRH